MGCVERYCALCGCPILQKSTILQLCKEKIYKKSDIYWLKDCYSLLSNNKLYSLYMTLSYINSGNINHDVIYYYTKKR